MHSKTTIGALAMLLIGGIITTALWWPDPQLPTALPASSTSAAPIELDPTTAGFRSDPAVRVGNAEQRRAVDSSLADERTTVAVVRGWVRDVDGLPIAAVLVRAGEFSTATTAVDGSYELALRARDARKKMQLVTEAFGWVPATQAITLVRDELTADFVLRSACVIEGRVVDSALVGIAGAKVTTFAAHHLSGQTDADGFFRLGDLDPRYEQCYVEASASGYVATSAVVTVSDGPVDDLVIVLSSGSVVRGVVYADLVPGWSPQADASVVITTRQSKSQNRVEQKSDASGRFEFLALPEGRHSLVVTHGDFAAHIGTVDVPASGEVVELTIELSAGRSLGGVVRAATGAPIVGAKLAAHSRVGKRGGATVLRSTETDDQGRFELRGLPSDEVRLSCRADGHLPANAIMVPATAVFHEIVMEATARLAGTVVDASSGAPIQEFAIRLRAAGGNGGGKTVGVGKRGEQVFRDELGRWDTDDVPLPVGMTLDLEVSAKGYASTLVQSLVARTDASYADHRIALASGLTLTGTVESDAGAPLAATDLWLVRVGDTALPAGKRGRHVVTTDSAGRFTIDSVAHGDVRLVVQHSDDAVFVHRANIPAGVARWDVTVRVSVQGELRGIVREPDGRVSAHADVALTAVDVPGLDGRTWRGKSNDAGRFTFRDLPVGLYRVARTETFGKPHETFSRHVVVTDSAPVEVELLASGVGRIHGRVLSGFADVVLPESLIVQWSPNYGDDVPMSERAPQRFSRATRGVIEWQGLEPGPCRLLAYGFSEASSAWIFGHVDIEVLEAGETPVELTLDGRK